MSRKIKYIFPKKKQLLYARRITSILTIKLRAPWPPNNHQQNKKDLSRPWGSVRNVKKFFMRILYPILVNAASVSLFIPTVVTLCYLRIHSHTYQYYIKILILI